MARFLFVVPPLIGHIRPTIAVAAQLLARGHDVAWAGDPALVGPRAPAGSRVFPAGVVEPPDTQGLRGLEALRFLWDEGLVPLAVMMRPEVDAAIEAFAPDVLVADQQAFAGALAARDHGLAWVTSATTTSELIDPLMTLPKLKAWRQSRMDFLTGETGGVGDIRFSDLLVLIYSSERLVGSEQPFPDHYAFVGPALQAPEADADFPWEWFDPRERARHVFVSLGTVTQEGGRDFLRRVGQAFSDPSDGIRLVIVAQPGTFDDDLPDHFLVRAHVPQLALLPLVDAVITHGGHNTVCESLANGLPLVVAPIRDDQPAIAHQVVTAGAGIRVKYGRVRPEGLRDAVLSVLDDPSYRAAALELKASFQAAGGAGAAADRLEEVVPRALPRRAGRQGH